MVTKSDVLALLEDGPEEAAQLAEWLEIEPARLLTVLDRMDIPGCAHCGRFFVPSAYSATRYCSRDCDQARIIRRPSFGSARGAAETQMGWRSTGASVERFRRVRRDGVDVDFEVVWNGVGPLPGAGDAAGLGSTLSGMHFSIGRRN
jgi:hypothetical protein